MKLFMLIERVGRRTRSFHPWFEPPAIGAPTRYFGWNWDPEERKWVESVISKTSVVVAGAAEEKPKYPPHGPQPAEVSGWKYDEQDGVWNEVPTAHREAWVEIRHPAKPTLPPTTGRGEEVLGWYYSSKDEEWKSVPIPAQYVDWYEERVEKPQYSPGHEQKSNVSGWHWDPNEKEWLPTIVATEVVDYQPLRPLPPSLTFEDVQAAGVYNVDVKEVIEALEASAQPIAAFSRVHIDNMIRMLTRSGYTEAAARGVLEQYAKLTAGLTSTEKAKVWSQATATIYRTWQRSHMMGVSESQRIWANNVGTYMTELKPILGTKTMVGVLVLTTAMIGVMIGTLLERITFPREGFIRLGQPGGQYIMHTEDWLYADFVGRSVKQNVYFASCGSIGTDYVRHKRAEPGSIHDTIDFPGGFIEEGWKGGLFVKYTWEHWTMSYIGMLSSVGQNLWQLKRADLKHFGSTGPVWQKKPEDWCPNYRWYL